MARIRGIDFDASGRQPRFIDLVHTDNRHDNGEIPVPIPVLAAQVMSDPQHGRTQAFLAAVR